MLPQLTRQTSLRSIARDHCDILKTKKKVLNDYDSLFFVIWRVWFLVFIIYLFLYGPFERFESKSRQGPDAIPESEPGQEVSIMLASCYIECLFVAFGRFGFYYFFFSVSVAIYLSKLMAQSVEWLSQQLGTAQAEITRLTVRLLAPRH